MFLNHCAAAGRECDIPSAPPVMQLRSKDFFKILFSPLHHLHPNSRILSEGQTQFSARGTPKFACSAATGNGVFQKQTPPFQRQRSQKV